MAKLLYFVLLAAVIWKAHADHDDEDQDFIPDTTQNNQEIKCGKHYAQYPNPDDCGSYIVCQNGEKTIKSCPAGQHYNFRTIRCVEPCEAYCNKTLSCECKWPTCGLDDVCFLEQIVGGCRNRVPRYFFNKRNGQCERFGYSGCMGNENNFETLEECQQKCTKAKPIPGFRCLTMNGRFPNPDNCRTYFQCSNGKPQLMSCESGLHYSDKSKTCEKPCDAYCDKSLSCECKWPTCGLNDLCFLPPEVGPCRAGFYNYYFNRRTGQCETFLYGGCQGNKNNFQKKEECEEACTKGDGPPVEEWLQPTSEESTEPPVDEFSDPSAEEVLDPSFECGPDGLYPHPKNCRSFVKCSKAVPTLNSCPAKLHFNNKTKKCETPCKAQCDRTYACKCKWPTCGTNALCFLPAKPGPCKGKFERFHFNKRSGECKAFEYGGCLGNENNFITKHACERKCKHSLDICKLPYKTGPCKGKFERYYFNHKEGKCQKFTFGGCNENHNNFKTIEECETTCLQDKEKSEDFTCVKDGLFKDPESCSSYIHCVNGQKYDMPCPTGYQFNEKTKFCETPSKAQCKEHKAYSENICRLPAEKGPCNAVIPKYYFNHEEGNCKKFTYGGCKGNGNNFDSKEECERSCLRKAAYSENICRLPAEKGPCNAVIPKYYFNHEEGTCKKFTYGGCKGNGNNFDSREECERSCLRKAAYSENICRLPAEKGPCNAVIPKYYFNHEEGNCKKFTYGGCKGNGNNFDSREECERSCLRKAVEKKIFEAAIFCVQNDTFEDLNNCSQYIHCYDDGKFTTKPCPAGQHYNVALKKCKEPCEAFCDPSFACKCGWPTCKDTSSEPICTEDGERLDFENCGRYIRCSNGQRQIVACPQGLHFNEATKQCDSPCDARCDMSLAMECGWPMGAEKISDPECAEDGMFTDSSSCNRFIHCSNGKKIVKSCPPGLHFNEKTKQCDSPCDALCDQSLAFECGWPMDAGDNHCPENEYYSFSGAACQRNCTNYKDWFVVCPLIWRPGCVCDKGYVRNAEGKCIPTEECESENEQSEDPDFVCPYPDGKFPYSGNSPKFIKCTNSKATVEQCPENQIYDFLKEECVRHR